MNRSFRIGTVAGIPVFLHWAFLLIPAYIILSGLALNHPISELLLGLTFVVAVFACVVLHELGHAVAARRFGIKTRDILLLPIGGVARLESVPRRPREELIVAIAGPTVNVIIASVLLLITVPFLGIDGLLHPQSVASNLVGKVIAVNLAMLVFNMLPAFPMDGGRVLRAVLSSEMGHVRASRVAVKVGQTMAVVMGLTGLFLVNNPMLVFIAGFVFLGAVREAGAAELESLPEDLHVSDIMTTRFDAVPAQASAVWALRFAISANKQELPVILSGRFQGVVRTEDLATAVAEGQPEMSVNLLCHRHVRHVQCDEPVTDAAKSLQSSEFAALPVVDSRGHLEGLFSSDSIRAARRYGSLLRTLTPSPLRDQPDELRQHLTRMQII